MHVAVTCLEEISETQAISHPYAIIRLHADKMEFNSLPSSSLFFCSNVFFFVLLHFVFIANFCKVKE